jgi:non-homologous end joining protein Ku
VAGIIFAKKQHILVRAVGQGDAWHEIALDYEVRDEKEFFKAIDHSPQAERNGEPCRSHPRHQTDHSDLT